MNKEEIKVGDLVEVTKVYGADIRRGISVGDKVVVKSITYGGSIYCKSDNYILQQDQVKKVQQEKKKMSLTIQFKDKIREPIIKTESELVSGDMFSFNIEGDRPTHIFMAMCIDHIATINIDGGCLYMSYYGEDDKVKVFGNKNVTITVE